MWREAGQLINMSKPAIIVENLSKRYRIGLKEKANRTFGEALYDTVAAPFRRLKNLGHAQADGEDTFWALKDVSFEVQPGEVVGIIGRNGAGKSTLLKVLSRITEPTSGRAVIHGRVGSLLEVGTGFHPELTGRENIYLNGAILGMKRAEITRKFDEIVAFSEIEKFLDTPVKRYSSGMYVRLAFAVAAHLEPEILIVDEVLAVGDVEFQRKCLGKMKDVAGCGRTVLFVSHQMNAVESLCTKALILSEGRVAASGLAGEVVRDYLQHNKGVTLKVVTKAVEFLGVLNRHSLDSVAATDSFEVALGFRTGPEELNAVRIDMELFNERRERVIHTRMKYTMRPPNMRPNSDVKCRIIFPPLHLSPGAYRATVWMSAGRTPLFWADDVDVLTVSATPALDIPVYEEDYRPVLAPAYRYDLQCCSSGDGGLAT